MADTTTSIYGLVKPEINVSTTWPTSLNADLDSLDDLLARPKQTFNSPAVGATTTLDLSLARVFAFTVSQATTIAFTNVPSSSFAVVVRLLVTNGAAFTLTFPGSVTWFPGTNPLFQASGLDEVEMVTIDGGTTWRSVMIGKNLQIAGLLKANYGTAAAFARPVQVAYENGNLSTGSTSEVSLASFSLPANSLPTNNDAVRITFHGNAVTQAACLRTKFGATYVFNNAGTNNIAAGNVFQVTAIVRRKDATNQFGLGAGVISATAASERSTPAETLSGAITIDVRGFTAVGGGTLNLDGISIEVLSQ